MKKLILSCIVAACLLSACNNNKKPAETKSEEEKAKVVADQDKMQKASEEIQKQSEELLKLVPLSNDQLKALLPEEMMTAKKSNSQANSVNGTGLAQAVYPLNDSTEIQVYISDCGGPGGSGYFSRQAMNMFTEQSKGDNESTITTDFMGQKALQHCDKNDNSCTLTFFDGKRFWVIIEGKNIHPDGLKQAARDLSL